MADETNAASSGGGTSLAELLQAEPPQVFDTAPGAEDQGGGQQDQGGQRDEVQTQDGGEPDGGDQQQELDETSLELNESDRDYSDQTYERYAKHFTSQWKLAKELDPQDPATRGMLREIIQRGENFRQLQANAQADEDARLQAAEEARQREEAEQDQRQRQTQTVDTPEQTQRFLEQVDQFSEQRIRPEVAKVFYTDFLTSLWGDKGRELAAKATPAEHKMFTKTMTKFGYLFLNDALPQILQDYVPGLINNSYPDLAPVLQDVVYERAFDIVAAENPDAAQILDDDAFGEQLAEVYKKHPFLKTATFDATDKVKNEAGRLKAALRFMDRQQQAPPAETVTRAVEQGRRQARTADQRRAAGRMAPGDSRGELGGNDPTDELMRGMGKNGDRDRQVQDMLAPKA